MNAVIFSPEGWMNMALEFGFTAMWFLFKKE
jgi:hypothetical protein